MLWSTDLTKDEVAVLLAFADHNPIAYPADCGLSNQDIAKTLSNLRKKDIIKDSRAPLALTKKGLRYLKSITTAQEEEFIVCHQLDDD
jgi:predicted transcriptional regulator